MADDAPPITTTARLTGEMKVYLDSKLEDTPSMVAQVLYSFLCREIRDGRIGGPSPELAQIRVEFGIKIQILC
ncbi:hypothetical protein PPTG_23525 [Phytophthora nicotianae INRA-310]|uniref:Uncharacterized protein n=1 Tax=Phytophthora nicotianae (strain INRA-310) TaxID=761204 RepID=W2PVJ4_PHYN3|nr:hypothetical protein PPTG_23525 [Phytophthora nicotianae INRA-310]ETN04983.1 hypothetical protein PPTG_23525 [Phytophthora nicotianae INRA-310]